jgi:tetratricopeptide (TPR) repeat protein
MKKHLIVVLCFITLSFYAQEEKRLALVIGNANYEKGKLKNPVNDAELVAKTLESLNFDVILKKNLESRSEFIRAIREFGKKRAEYDVAFVYYAGHGVQVDNENFLLPTKEEFLTEDDVLDFGVSVQNILRYLESTSEKINILILDACRDNPFEIEWNATRSLKGSGLAKIPPPTGSLIAFSTDAGRTAADGKDKNSVYCKSLCKNFLLEDVSIDQIFRNVRSDVSKSTNNKQRPIESSQLTGETFYLNRPTCDLLIDRVNQFLIEKKYDDAKKVSEIIIDYYPKNPLGYCKLAQSYFMKENYDEAVKNYLIAYEINEFCEDIYHCTIFWKDDERDISLFDLPAKYHDFFQSKSGKTITEVYKNWLNYDRSNPLAYFALSKMGTSDSVKILINQCLKISTNNINGIYENGAFASLDAICYFTLAYNHKNLNELNEAYKNNQLAIEAELSINPKSKNVAHMYALNGEIYSRQMNFKKAIGELNKAITILPNSSRFYADLGEIYELENKLDSALILKEKSLELSDSKLDISWSHFRISLTYILKNDDLNAFTEILTAMNVDSETYEIFYRSVMAYCYFKLDRSNLFCSEFQKIHPTIENEKRWINTLNNFFENYFNFSDLLEIYEDCK